MREMTSTNSRLVYGASGAMNHALVRSSMSKTKTLAGKMVANHVSPVSIFKRKMHDLFVVGLGGLKARFVLIA